MDPFHYAGGAPYTCQWCVTNNSGVIFENAKLCHTCHQKALLAVQHPRLCELCSSLLTVKNVTQALFSEDGFSHTNLRGLQAAAESGCGLCRLFLLQNPDSDVARLPLPLSLFAESEMKENSEFDIKSLYFSSDPTVRDLIKLKLSVAALDDHASMVTRQLPVETNLGEDTTVKQIREWLEECLTTHDESLSHDGHTSLHRGKLPTRVIDVGTELQPVTKLFQPSTIMLEKYITLSYCWGREPFITTLSTNIESHFEGLKDSNMPQTFIDAIKITRSLGFRYLWIDALCIIQDSMEDKAIEIGAMEGIYSDSTLTIAVVNATRVAEGFLQTKPRLTVNIPCHTPNGTLGKIQVSPQETIDLWQESLYTRAWCLQENLLSARLLLFTNTEVLWQCQSSPFRRPDTTHVEYMYENPQLGPSPFYRIPASVSTPKPSSLQSTPSSDLELVRYTTWRNIVQNYTRRNITVLSDRLPAIAGIAQKFKDSWGDEYCAGIWKRHFMASLAWKRKKIWQGPTEQYWPPLQQYRAPSWSWASIEGPIEFDRRLDLGDIRGLGAKLISCDVVPLRQQAPLGEVQHGKAVLEVSLVPARDVPTRGLAGQDAESYRIGGHLSLDNHSKDLWPGPGRADVLRGELWDHAWAMLLGEGRDGSGKMTTTTALILMPMDGEVDTFQRVGFWDCSVKGSSKLWVGARKRMTITIV